MECTIYLAESCNMICSYCYQQNERKSKILDEITLRKTISFLVENSDGKDFIDLKFWGGEPLQNLRSFYKTFEIIENEYPEYTKLFRYQIKTNGTLINDKVIDYFLKYNIAVTLSMDGDSYTHNLNREDKKGKNIYPVLMANLIKMLTRNVNFSIKMTVTCNNVKYLMRNVKFFYQLNVKKINVTFDEFAEWDDESLKILDRQLSKLDGYYLNKALSNTELILNLYDNKINTFTAKKRSLYCCEGMDQHFVISSSGDIYPCGYVVNQKEWKIGNVSDGYYEARHIHSLKRYTKNILNCKCCDQAFPYNRSRCGFKNNQHAENLDFYNNVTSKLDTILSCHNRSVFGQLYDIKHNRFSYFYKSSKGQNIENVKYLNNLSLSKV